MLRSRISGNINVPIFRPGWNLVQAFPRENWEPEMHKFERIRSFEYCEF